jgi:hypothetical protein
MIAFVDFEASALEASYPMEIGWARMDGMFPVSALRTD